MNEIEQVLTVKISILNRPEEGIGTATYTFNRQTGILELSVKVADAIRHASADAFSTIAEPVLMAALDEINREQ